MADKEPDLAMETITIEVQIPKNAYKKVVQWANKNKLPGSVKGALRRHLTTAFAQMYQNSMASESGLVNADGDPLKAPGGLSDA